jgi:hypothetical protein
MIRKAIDALSMRLSGGLALSNSRLETLCLLVIGIASVRTVNLSHICCEMPTQAKVESTYRRLQRFFQFVDLEQDWSARLVVRMLGLTGSWNLCLDRTNWKIGRQEINVLVLAVATRRFRVPLIWTVLGKAGNSNTQERVALMKRYLGLFGAGSIKYLLADREFIGLEWLTFLDDQGVPFVIRVRSNQYVNTEDGTRQSLKKLLRTCRGPRTFVGHFGLAGAPLWLNFAAKRIKGKELLIVVSNRPAHHALSTYRKRWAIECLFAEAKTRGFNLEDTRLSIAKKLSLLIGLVALAMAWAAKIASAKLGAQKRPRKTHGRFAKSIFRIGLDEIRRLLRTNPDLAFRHWPKSTAKIA